VCDTLPCVAPPDPDDLIHAYETDASEKRHESGTAGATAVPCARVVPIVMDDRVDTFESNLLRNLMDSWVTPDVRRRQEAGSLEKPLHIRMAQIVFFPNGRAPAVRINNEVRGRGRFKFKEPLHEPIAAGDPVYWNQIDGLESFQLDPEERDYGHATIFSFEQSWVITFDFIYNKRRSAEHIAAAREYLVAAKSSWRASLCRPFVDNLAAASELAAKAYLLGRPDQSVMEGKTHQTIHLKINAGRRLGNVASQAIDSFNLLQELRYRARYLSRELDISQPAAASMIADTEGFLSAVEERIRDKL
jgi:hypothetical protein